MAHDSGSVGSKARSLVKLSEAGFPVPRFHVIPFEVYREAKKESLHIPSSYRHEFESVVKKFSDTPVAVRSSASKEDGEQMSFAGLFESFLNVQGEEQIEQSVKNCWHSTQTERTQRYCEKNNLNSAELEMAVIIQQYIDPDFAGVAFTMNPITGNDQEMIVEACPGSGDKLVSGLVNPSRFILHRDQAEILKSSDDKMKIAPSQDILQQLRHLCQQIQAFYGKPQDVEFAVKNGKVFILQSRDITKIQYSKDMGEWTTSDFRDGGVSSAVVSPVMWSLYEKIFATSLPDYFVKLKLITQEKADSIQWYKVFYGRPYWNLRAVKDIQETLPGYNERNFDKDMALPINYEGDGVTTPFTLKGLLKALPVLSALHKEYDIQKNRSEQLLEHFPKIEEFYKNLNLSKMTENELQDSFRKLVTEDFMHVESEYFQTIYNASNAKMEFSDELKAYKKIDSSLEYINLISELGHLQVTGPAFFLTKVAHDFSEKEPKAAYIVETLLQKKEAIHLSDLEKVPFLKEQLQEFATRYYFHSERELDLLVPRWSEDLRFALETLKSLLSAGLQKPAPGLRKSIYATELEKMKQAHQKSIKRWIPGAWSGVMKKLERIRHFLWLREEVRDRSTRMYYFIRCHLLELGRRTQLNELIFHLSYQQIFAYCDGTVSLEKLKEQALQTKLYAEGFRNYKNSNEIGFRFNNASWAARSQVTNGKTSYYGIGCSAGHVQAKACVIKDIAEASRLKQGDIMIVPFTDPGWTPLFSLAAGVVTETGGLLSHAALISREYGIPCVLNLNGATDVIPDGATIEIDGMEGRVTLL